MIDESLVDPQLLCRQKNASVDGVFGPFGLLVLASEDLKEQTAVFFRIFERKNKHVVLMCSDQSRYGSFLDHELLQITSFLICTHHAFDFNRSSLQTPVKEAIFGSFLDVELDHEISLRTLVCCL